MVRLTVELVSIGALATASVALWTLRVALAARGRKVAGALVASVEALAFVIAFGHVASHLDRPAFVVAYVVGVASGTFIALTFDERASRGQSLIHAVLADGEVLLGGLHALGWPATGQHSIGPNGEVCAVMLAVEDRKVATALHDIRGLAPEAVWTVHRVREAHAIQATPLRRAVAVGARRAA